MGGGGKGRIIWRFCERKVTLDWTDHEGGCEGERKIIVWDRNGDFPCQGSSARIRHVSRRRRRGSHITSDMSSGVQVKSPAGSAGFRMQSNAVHQDFNSERQLHSRHCTAQKMISKPAPSLLIGGIESRQETHLQPLPSWHIKFVIWIYPSYQHPQHFPSA